MDQTEGYAEIKFSENLQEFLFRYMATKGIFGRSDKNNEVK